MSQSQVAVQSLPQKWKPPTHRVLKVNVDGSFVAEFGECAIGIDRVCRDSFDKLLDGFAYSVEWPLRFKRK